MGYMVVIWILRGESKELKPLMKVIYLGVKVVSQTSN